MAEIVILIIAKVAKYLVAPVGRQLGYLFNYNSNVEDFKNQLEKLGDVRGRVERDVDAATRNGDKIESDVEDWLKSVNGITEDAGKFFDDEDKAKKRCFNGLCPNLKSRYQLSKKAKKTTQEIVKFQGDGKFDRVSYPAALRGIESTSTKGYEAFESRMSTLKEIIEALSYPNINVIGVYGMGGVGKTTLVKEVAKQAKEDKLFDEVVMAEVSETPDLKEIRGTIADMLGLKFDQASESGRANRLRERLKKEKRILVILDNIWGKLNLEEVGIPIGDDHKGCKILLTSRSQDVLSNQMDTQKNFGIGVLLEEEAWNLFKKMAGDSVEDPDLQPTAIEVAKKCACLPLAIVTVAKALKNKSLFVWKDALQQLRRSNPTNIMGMHADVYSSLELSYNHLESEEVKLLFLLCGLLDYQIPIEDLLKYGMGLGLFQEIYTLEEARNRLHTLLHNLKASCLLPDSDINRNVKMHDVVRDVAISIASKDQNVFMVRRGVRFKEWPKKDILKNCTAISLHYNNVHDLPEWLECPELQFFLLGSNDPALKIPDTFFKEMKELKVLDLTGIHFSSLPLSIHFLANLQSLCLDYCIVGDIAIIGELKNLEILSFLGSDLVQLPTEIGQLTRLRLLDLTNCSKLQVIPPNVISSLSQLVELCMKNSFVQWEVDGLNNQGRNASLVELKHLPSLIALEVQIPDDEILPKGLLFENLIRYRILIGDAWDWSGDNETSRALKLKHNTSSHLKDEVNMLLKRTEDLYLDELMGIKNLLYDLDREGFPQLKHLHVQSNPEIQFIVNSMEWVPCSAFPILESLFLNNLGNLEIICRGQLPVESFCKLRVIKVECCDKLKNIFSLSMARGLLQLQEMEITDCKIMGVIVAEGREDEEDNNIEAMDKIMFPQLRCLTLLRMPELMSFCSKVKTMPSIPFRRQKLSTTDAGSGEIIPEGEHDIPILLFDQKVAFPSLEFLKLSELSKLKQIWHSQLPVETYINLQCLVVEKCASLLNVVSSNVLQSLQNLEIMTVESCDSVEQVFDLEGLNCDEEHARLLSHLVGLKLIELPRLRCIWNKDPQGILSFQNLKWLNVEKCNSLRNLFSPSVALDLVQLQGMNVINCDMMEEIVEKEKGAKEAAKEKIVFPLLRSIILNDLPNLTSFYPGNYTFECPSLKQMGIVGCPKIKTFTSKYEGLHGIFGEGELDIPSALLFNEKFAFPNLEDLVIKSTGSQKYIFESNVVRVTQLLLYDLPSLMQIWKKNSQGIFPFQMLSLLVVSGCPQLRNIFTISISKSLVELQKLLIISCHMVEEIVEKEGVEEAVTDKIVFPQVTSLTLCNLEQLKSFCRGIHISEWPSLKKLQVITCFHVDIFVSELISFEETRGKGHRGTPTKQPLFLVDKVAFPNLEELELVNLSTMEEIWQGQFHARSFCKLRVLKVIGCREILKVLPISLLQNLQNLEELYVDNCSSLEEVFELRGVAGEVGHAATLPQLRELRLIGLPKLMRLWKKDSQLYLVLQNLTTLKLRWCDNLTHLLPSTIATSLVQIKNITVDGCNMMKEIIASEEGEVTDETTFNQLNSLELTNLPNLTSFCPGRNDFSLSSLEKVFVKGCPKLKTFSNGILSTPELEKVHVQEDKWLWKGNLNTTIQHLFVQK